MRSLQDNLIGSILFLVLLVAVMLASLSLFSPAPRPAVSAF